MVLPSQLASAYAIFAIHAASPDFFADLEVKSHTCAIDGPNVELRVINGNFSNWSHQQVAEWAASPEHFNNPSSPFQPSVFVVIDEDSERENSIVVVSLDKHDLRRIRGTVRADLCFASVIPSLIDFGWDSIEDWQERALEFGGVVRDTPIQEDAMQMLTEEFPFGPNQWVTSAGLHVTTFSDGVAGDTVWIAGIGEDTLRSKLIDGDVPRTAGETISVQDCNDLR